LGQKSKGTYVPTAERMNSGAAEEEENNADNRSEEIKLSWATGEEVRVKGIKSSCKENQPDSKIGRGRFPAENLKRNETERIGHKTR